MLVILSVATHPKSPKTLIASAIGGMVLIGSLVGGPFTGAAMNPARYLAPAMAEGNWEGWWLYLPGAFIGAVSASLLYEQIRSKN
jgi:glycerol uptake facilitator-like aquaporin